MRTHACFAVSLVAIISLGLALVAGCGKAKPKPTPSPQAPTQPAQPAPPPDSGTTPAPAPQAAPEEAKREGVKDFPLPRPVATYDVSGAKRLVIGNPYGHVFAEPGGTKVEVKQEVYARGKTEAEAEQKAGAFKLVQKQQKGDLSVEVEGDPKNLDVGVNLRVRVPPSLNLKIRVAEGAVRVGDMQGSVEVDATAQAVTIGNVRGEVKANTSAGDLTIKGAGRGLLAQTSSGAIDVANAQGASVIARTMGGAIKLRALRADKLIVTTMSGPADVSVALPFSGQGEVRSASGDLVVAIPKTSNCQVKTMTGSGSIKVTLPLKEEKHEGLNISGRLGAGKGLLLVTNNTGGIEVKATP